MLVRPPLHVVAEPDRAGLEAHVGLREVIPSGQPVGLLRANPEQLGNLGEPDKVVRHALKVAAFP